MKRDIGSHYTQDEWRLYEFVRDSKIPHGTFDRGISADAVVVGACVVCLALALLGMWIGALL